MGEKILFIEDDTALAMGTGYSLQSEGMDVVCACDFATAQVKLTGKEEEFDLVLLDVMLPDADSYEICQWIREINPSLPIIFLTALDDEGNVVHGLEVGGSDYVTKPFRMKELVARIRANIRKNNLPEREEMIIDDKNFSLIRNGSHIILTPSEFKLVRELMENRGRTLTREQLIDRLWSVDEAFVDDNTLSVYIRRIREKIDEPGEKSRIRTVRGVGYAWEGGKKK